MQCILIISIYYFNYFVLEMYMLFVSCSYYVLEMSESIDDFGQINWKLALCLLLAWIIVLVCLIRGIQSLGKVREYNCLGFIVLICHLSYTSYIVVRLWMVCPMLSKVNLESRLWPHYGLVMER